MRQRGVAVITALLVVALVTAATGFIAWRQQLWLRTVENQLNMAQAKGIARAALSLVRAELNDDRRRDGNRYDYPGKAWAVPISNIPVEQGTAGGLVRDLQGRFNLNNLVSSSGQPNDAWIDACRRLFSELQLPAELVANLQAWIDPGLTQRSDGGAEDDYYLGLAEPYRAANQALTDVNNLYRIKGFTPQVVDVLRPYVTVLPTSGSPIPVNVNFAPVAVLRALIGGEAALAVVQQRQNKPFENMEMLRLAVSEGVRENIQPSIVDVKTDYFEAVTHARFGSVAVAYTSLLSRDTQGSSSTFPRVIWMRRSDLAEKSRSD